MDLYNIIRDNINEDEIGQKLEEYIIDAINEFDYDELIATYVSEHLQDEIEDNLRTIIDEILDNYEF